MTEIPEHLLARSKARRDAIGQSGGDAPAGDAPASAAVEKAGAAAPAAAAGPEGAPGLVPAKAPAALAATPPPPVRPEVAAARTRKKIPYWAVPAVVALPLWAIMYAFTLEPPAVGLSPALTEGEHLYSIAGAACAGCHGPDGEGGVGPALHDGDVIEVFSNYEDHVAWVELGTNEWPDATYGDTAKPVGGSGNVMPGFGPEGGGSLSEEEILLVVRYEREIVSGFGCEPELAEATGEECAPGTEAAAG
jgi:mono/diheme cytochrome c family protein